MSTKVFLRCVLAGAASALALAAGNAVAGVPAPYDAAPGEGAPVALPTLLTGLFGLGFDLASVGVDDAELATAGPTASSSSSSGAMLVVDDNLLDCPNAQFTTVQAAVTAATPGAKIKVCRGTYVEQVLVPAGKDGITLFSVPDLEAVIKAPPVMASPKSIVTVQAQDVTIRHFTITGPGGGPCDSLEYGVRVDSGGSALITDNHIAEIRDTPFSGCQNGVGVLIGRNLNNTSGSGTVVHNLIDGYQKGGIVVDGQLAPNTPKSNAEVAHNIVVGIGPTPVIAQNGIQISRGAFADVHHNVVSGNAYSLFPFFGEGILLFDVSSPQVTVHHNNVFENADGIGLYTTSNAEVGWNRSHDNLFYDGIFADVDTADNVIEHNKLKDNAMFDCDDASAGPYNPPALVANPWIQDLGYTENRPGLCKHAS